MISIKTFIYSVKCAIKGPSSGLLHQRKITLLCHTGACNNAKFPTMLATLWLDTQLKFASPLSMTVLSDVNTGTMLWLSTFTRMILSAVKGVTQYILKV